MTVILDVKVEISIRDSTDAHGVVSVLKSVITPFQLVAFNGDQSPIMSINGHVEVRVARQIRSW